LDPSLQQGRKIPRWKPQSRAGVYLGLSPQHASSVPLVLSTTTGLVSPQFHVVYEVFFTTTKCLHTNELPTHWPTLLTSSTVKYVDDDFSTSTFSDPSWFQDAPTSSSLSDTLSSLQREQASISPSSTTFSRELSLSPSDSPAPQREVSASDNVHSGWNSSHSYETHFKQKHHANSAIHLQATDTPIDDHLYSALFAVQDYHPRHSRTNLLPQGALLFSADTKSMYTNINTSICLKEIEEFIYTKQN
jgi:hypothetical protein